jgi:hypothetical protein
MLLNLWLSEFLHSQKQGKHGKDKETNACSQEYAMLDPISSINDLGVIMDEKMNFSEHIDVMVGKAFACWGLIRRLSFEFRDPYTRI